MTINVFKYILSFKRNYRSLKIKNHETMIWIIISFCLNVYFHKKWILTGYYIHTWWFQNINKVSMFLQSVDEMTFTTMDEMEFFKIILRNRTTIPSGVLNYVDLSFAWTTTWFIIRVWRCKFISTVQFTLSCFWQMAKSLGKYISI